MMNFRRAHRLTIWENILDGQLDRNHTGEVSIIGDTIMSTEHTQQGVIHCSEKGGGGLEK